MKIETGTKLKRHSKEMTLVLLLTLSRVTWSCLENRWTISSRLSLQDKILLGGGKGGTVTVTNDGATILKAIGVDNPAAKVLVGEWRRWVSAEQTAREV